MQIKNNIAPYIRDEEDIGFIVIHDTGNKQSGANALMHYEYWNSGNKNSSADFVVDDTRILQINDYNIFYTWHCGDGHGQYGISNKNSIGVEMCINSDGDFLKTLMNTITLVKNLQQKLIFAKVVRHYDASRKNCPASLNYNDWEGWTKFLKMLEVEDMTNEEIRKTIGMDDATWAKEQMEISKKNGLIKSDHDVNEPVTIGLLMQILNTLYDKLK